MDNGRKFVETFLHHIADRDIAMNAFDKFSKEVITYVVMSLA